MIIYSRVIEAPVIEPVTLDEAKDQLHIELDDHSQDDRITSLIKVARRLCESYTSLSFMTQQRQMKLDRFPWWRNMMPGHPVDSRFIARWRRHDGIIVPYGPVQNIDEINYIDPSGVVQVLASSAYHADIHSDLARLFPVDSWPDTDINIPNAVTIKYTAGYDPISGGTEEFPEEAKQAMLMQIVSMEQNRQDEVVGGGAVAKLCWNSEKILDTIKVYWDANQD